MADVGEAGRPGHTPATRPAEESLPPAVSIALDETLRTYWDARVRQSNFDSYAGVPIGKFPEDLRVYEHLLWASRASTVVEIGSDFGGSALWFRDRLATMARYGRIDRGHVITIDIDIEKARERIDATDPSGITLVDGDILDPELPNHVARLISAGSRCFVVEDSAHTYDTTLAALTGFAGFVPLGGYFVVEDGCVDVEEMRIHDDWPRGVLPALREWLASASGSDFTERRDLERYGVSCHPHGFLERLHGGPNESERARSRRLPWRRRRRTDAPAR